MSNAVTDAVSGAERGRADAAPMTSHPALLVRLTREWRAISHRPSVLRRAAQWPLGVTFESLDDLVAATGWRDRSSTDVDPTLVAPCSADQSARANEVLGRLVLVARTDELAARVVLQRLLPGLAGVARRWSRRHEGGPDALDELLAAAWTVIRTHPVERRPDHVAAQLLRAAEYHAFVRPGRRMLVVQSVPGERLDLPVPPVDDTPAAVELAELIAATHTLTERDRELLALIVAGRSSTEVAEALEVSVRTVTNHRDAMVSRLRQTARALAAA